MQKDKRLHIAFDPIYAHPLPEGHRFPMLKYELIPQQLLYEGTITEGNLCSPYPCPDEIILLTHKKEYLDKLKNQTLSAKEQRHIGFPQSSVLTQRELIITQGTINCCYSALANGVALNVAGGTHHAFAERGEGFCLLNDFAVAAIFTFSMHGRNNYPFRKEKSDLDLELEDGTTTNDYLQKLAAVLPPLIERVKPDFVFYLSGVDILDTDKFGKLKVTIDGCKERDRFVFSTLRKFGLPCAVAMGGGYSPQVKTIVEAHANTFRLVKSIYDLH